jgi:putative hydrolase of the HAD superfamily
MADLRKNLLLFDWGDTLMRDLPEFFGPMAGWPRVELMPGVIEVLRSLQDRWHFAIATNAADSDEAQIRQALRRVDLDGWIEQIYCARSVGARKPSPEFFRFILEHATARNNGKRPERVVMVGDNFEVDILGASRAGIPGIWLNQRSSEERSGVLFRTIHSLGALPKALETLQSGFEPYLRIDSLTGCGNLLSFLEWLSGQSPIGPASLATLDLNQFADVNLLQGHERGDAVLRWVGLLLQDFLPGPVFRTGGDEFLAALKGDDFAQHILLCEALFDRLNQEAGRIGLAAPVASLAIVSYPASVACSPAQVMSYQSVALAAVKQGGRRLMEAFAMETLSMPVDTSALVNYLIARMVELGARLDEAHHMALSDPLTGLPNVRAAMRLLENSDQACQSVLLIDGDNLKRYNTLGGYSAGDRMICNLGAVLQAHLRPGDFLARWRTGDEFLVILEECSVDEAQVIAERLRQAVVDASQTWLLPVSVSIGVAEARERYKTIDELLAAAENAQVAAKEAGKNRVVQAGAIAS